jgi:DNA polymerase-3 subunit beta
MIVEVKQLREALKKVGVAVAKRTTLPITNSVLLESKGVEVTIKSTNLESGVVVSLPCGSGEDFSVCVSYKAFSKFVSEGDGQVFIDLTQGGKGITLSRPTIGKLTIGVVYGKEFPPLPVSKPEAVWNKLDGEEVSRLFGIVTFGCASDESRPVLTAVCCRDGEIASADGFRLYNAKSEKFNFGLGIIYGEGHFSTTTYPVNKLIPRATVLKFIQLFKNGEVEVAWGDNLVFFRTKDCTLISQLVQGTYPKYETLIPVSFNSKVSFSVPLMIQRLKLMSPVVDGSRTVRMIFIQKDNQCLLQSNHSGDLDTPEYDMSLPCKVEQEGKIAVDYKYLLEAIKPFSMCSIETTNPASPMKFTGDIEGLTVIVMPLFVQW